MNNELRIKIVEMVKRSGEGHIPSSFSIVDILDYLYGEVLTYRADYPTWSKRDYFVLSKGHGCGALYAVLNKYKFLTEDDLLTYSTAKGILGGHPDMTKVPGIEASTGSLGHGFPTAVGIALGLKIQNKNNAVYCLVGDGECHEGTVWESCNVATNLELGNLSVIVDWNGSAQQLMPKDSLVEKFKAFGFETILMNGHSRNDFKVVFKKVNSNKGTKPKAIIAKTIKGKGVSFLEGHGLWHHKVPNDSELEKIYKELSS